MLFKAETTEVTPIVGSSISLWGPGHAAEPAQGAAGRSPSRDGAGQDQTLATRGGGCSLLLCS